MAGFLKTLGNFFTYKEPSNDELGFELLEDENEGNEEQDKLASESSKKNQRNNTQQNNTCNSSDNQAGSKQDKAEENQQDNGQNENGNNNKPDENPIGEKTTSKQSYSQPQNKTQQTGKSKQQINFQKKSNSSQQGNTPKSSKDQEQSEQIQKSNNQQLSDAENLKFAKAPIKVEEWNERKKNDTPRQNQTSQEVNNPDLVSSTLSVNLDTIKKNFDMPKNQDIIIREFKIGRKINVFMVYVDGMIDKQTLNLAVLPQLMAKELYEELKEENTVDFLIQNVLTVHIVNKEKYFHKIEKQVLNGGSALFIEGSDTSILIETRGYEKRNIDTPKTEVVVKGSQEGFTENLRTNITMIRRIIRSRDLVTEILPVGNTNNLSCAVLYLKGIANQKVIGEVTKRINSINSDFVMGDGMVEQFIEDNPLMLFPQVLTTERPDRTASFIMEGQVVIIAEGTPFAMAVPVTFFRLLHTSEDSFTRWPFGTFLRFIRIFGLFCATLLPGIYISIIMFHPEMIPTELLSSISRAKESVPFPTLLEVLIMEMAFELIREGGIRVPSVIGQTLGIVGALILGQAAVSAGLVSPILVIIVSVTALGSFAIPNYSLSLAIRVERFFFIFAGALFGFLGIGVMIFILACVACSMKSFGVPFFSPVAPRTRVNMDIAIRGPIWMQKNRADSHQTPNRKRQGKNKRIWISEEDQSREGGE